MPPTLSAPSVLSSSRWQKQQIAACPMHLVIFDTAKTSNCCLLHPSCHLQHGKNKILLYRTVLEIKAKTPFRAPSGDSDKWYWLGRSCKPHNKILPQYFAHVLNFCLPLSIYVLNKHAAYCFDDKSFRLRLWLPSGLFGTQQFQALSLCRHRASSDSCCYVHTPQAV